MPNNFCFDQIYLTNETYAFYTFSNPIFDSFDVQELRDCSTNDELHVPEARRGSTSGEDLGAMKSNTEKGGSQSDGRGYNRQPEACSSSRLLLISDTKQKWASFCDNFAFSVRNKLFVMETNFKRRLRALRRFLDKKLPQRLLQAAPSENKLSKQERLAAKSFVRRPNLDELLKLEQNQQRNRTSRLLNLSEPISAKALGAQQEHILSRLERIKRDNQRLASSSSCSSIGLVHQQSCPSDRQDQQRVSKMSGKTKAVKFGCWPAESQSRQAGWRMPKSASSPSQMTIPFCLARAQGQELDSVCSSASTSSSEALTDSPAASTSSCKAAPATDAAKTTTASATERPKPTASRATPPTPRSKATRRWSVISSVQRQTKTSRSSDGSEEPAAQKKTCIVCYERAPNIVTLPCEHSDICSDCFIEIIYMAVKNSQYPLRCVLCRQKVERIRCSRRLMLSVIKRNRTKTSAKCGGAAALLSF